MTKILIVDDDEGVTTTFARMLRLEGYQVHTAATAEKGLAEAEQNHPDAIILDMRMPLVDGLGFLRRLRAFDADDGRILWEAVVGGMIMGSTISYAVNGKQYLMVFSGEGQSVTAGPLGLTQKSMPRAVRGHNSIFVFALP